MMSLSVSAPKLAPQILKLAGFEKEYERLAQRAQRENSILMRQGWREVAAYKTGHYRSKIRSEVRSIPGEIHAVASTDVRSPRGFPYPRALEESTRYHYRSTSRKGQQTQGQVARKFRELKPQFDAKFKTMGDELARALAV
jgi:hypothetical protein